MEGLNCLSVGLFRNQAVLYRYQLRLRDRGYRKIESGCTGGVTLHQVNKDYRIHLIFQTKKSNSLLLE